MIQSTSAHKIRPILETKRTSTSILSMVIFDIQKDDVLLGRGALTVKNEGNKSFRLIVEPWKPEYRLANRKRKNEIAVLVVNEVFRRGGRFLERINENIMNELGLSEHSRAWAVAEMHVALEKVCFQS